MEYLALGNTVAVVPPAKPLAYTGLTTADKYINEEEKATYATKKRHFDAVKRMIFYVCGESYFLALKDAHGYIVGTPPPPLTTTHRTFTYQVYYSYPEGK